VRTNILNWRGDDVVSVEEFTDYMDQLTGLFPGTMSATTGAGSSGTNS
jgi:hypothetical protein